MRGFTKELTENILPFWMNKMADNENGGFYGQIDGDGRRHNDANKGAVLNARILWTFAAAYRIQGDERYLAMATRAYEYIKQYFIDKEFGGIYWELDHKGNPVNTKKQIYAQGFALYGLSEYHRATGERESLSLAKDLFSLIEKHKDGRFGGYFEAFTREWNPIEDMRLSDKDANEKKSMNTHLHILEAYTNLLRIWHNDVLRNVQRELISIFTNKIRDSRTANLNLFFAEDWTVKSSAVSFGHDIEAAWLLYEAAEVLNDADVLENVRDLSLKITDAAYEGMQADGSMVYEKEDGRIDRERHWWVQAEAVAGSMYAYKNSGDGKYKRNAARVWRYIQNNIIDQRCGEWHWSRLPDGTVNTGKDKAGFWKCPYHNSRMCLEMIEHFGLT